MNSGDEIAILRAEIAALQREVRRRRIGGRHRWRVSLAVVGLLALTLAPLGALGAYFVDLNPGSGHNPNIYAIADAGITRGCFDTAHYCPNDFVTREQMASFLARTAGLGGNPPVANAAALNGWPANTLVRAGVAGSGASAFVVTGSYQTFASVSIAIPASGFVLVHGMVHIYGGSNSFAPVFVRLLDPANNLQSLDQIATVGSVAGSTLDTSVAPVVRFPAYGSGTRTYLLQVARNNTYSTGSTYADGAVISVLFVPFGAGGAQAAGAGPGAAAADGDADPGTIPLRDAPPEWPGRAP